MPEKINVADWLTKKEYLMYHSNEGDTEIYESLAANRALLKKHEWGFRVVNPDNTRDRFICLECKQDFEYGHTPDCAIARALEGVKGGE